MRPLRLKLRGFRSFETLELDLPVGCVAVTGENGAGKSTLITAIEFALFGPEGRSLEPYATLGGDGEMTVELELEHSGEHYRVRRAWSARGRGKSTLDLEQLTERMAFRPGVGDREDDEYPAIAYEPLTEASAADTQTAIEKLLGLTRDTFRASAFLAQGDGAAFTDAQPKDRKRLLSDVLGLHLWEHARERVSADRTQQQRAASEIEGRMQLLAEQAGDVDEAEREAQAIAELMAQADQDYVDRRDEHAEQVEAVANVERQHAQHTARRSAVGAAQARVDAHQRVKDEADRALQEVVQARAEISDLERDEHERRGLATVVEDKREQSRAGRAAAEEIERHEAEAARLTRTLSEQTIELGRVQGKLEALALPGSVCDRCQQELDQAARDSARESLTRDLEKARETFAGTQTALEAARAAAASVEIPPPVEGLADAEQRLAELAAAPANLAAASERVRHLDELIARAQADDYLAEADRLAGELAAARAALDELEPSPPLDSVTARRDEAARRLAEAEAVREELRARKAAADAMLVRVAQAQEILAEARRTHDEISADLAQLTTLERAFGRDGVPAWIVEQQAIPAIEAEANRILAELAGPVQRVELRTERELKSGGTRDALDIVCVTDAGAREYSTFSGGERTRVDLALRLALARLLASRRGADVRMLAIDEPDGLDEKGMAALVGVLRDLTQRDVFDQAYVVSHTPALRDSFDRALVCSINGGGSEVQVA